MKEYEGPAYQQAEGDESIKDRRFNRLSQRDATKSQFEPALKRRGSQESAKRPVDFNQQLPSARVTARTRQPNRMSEKYTAAENSAAEYSRPENQSLGKHNQIVTPPDDYQVPFLKQHPRSRKQLDQASLEDTMTQRQFELTQPPSQPKQTVAPIKQYRRQQEHNSQETASQELEEQPHVNETEVKQTQAQVIVKPKFQPTTLPKPYQGAESSRKNKVTDRELARRLVKTREMFLLFEN